MRVVLKKLGLEKAVVLGLILACPYGVAAAADYEVGVSWNDKSHQVINDDYDITHTKSATVISLGNCSDITINSKELKATVIGDNANIVEGLSVIRGDVKVADGIRITTFIKSENGANLRAFGVDLIGSDAYPTTIVLGKNTVVSAEAQGGVNNWVYGIYNYEKNDITLGDGSVVTVKNNSGSADAIMHDGSDTVKSNVKIGDNVALLAEITDGQLGVRNHVSGLNNQTGDVVTAGNKLYIEASSTTQTDGARARVDAINNLYGANTTIGDDLAVAAKAEGTTGEIKSFAVYNYQSQFKAGANTVILTSAAGNAANSDVNAWAVINQDNSQMTFGDNVKIQARTSESGLAVAVLNQSDSVVDFEGSLYVDGTDFSLYSTDGATVNAVAAGKDKVIIGDMYSNSGAKINAVLDTAGSLFEGAALIGAAGGDINFTMSNDALWKMTGDSSVTKLTLIGGAVVDMSQHDTYQQLDVAELSGSGGEFIMKTDLASETDGDKLYITAAAAGTSQLVQVADVSLSSGMVVTGEKKLLLITDASKNATFVGKKLNEGGLWDVTPTIENGLAIGESEEEWYLTKLAKNVNNDTEVLLNASDNSYALWRNSNDTLRKRLGDLRYRSNQTDSDGIWARYIGGKFGSGSFDGRYNLYQLGYDKAVDARSTYGIAVESGTGRGDYAAGSSKDKLWTGSLYGTWYGSNGTYTDVVARYGHFDTDINSYGDYPDKANNKNHAYSLSIEYGKTIELSEKRGTFIEPQVQFIMGRMSSSSYTTDRGNNVYLGAVNSYIGRLGIVAGQKMSDGNDVYFKANLLHEFGGDRDIYMRAANGETLSDSRDYGDTWFELGLGGNIRMGKNSSFYGDIERNFGADIQKKWQINAGVRFEF
ncbi:MAG: autotransporter outer membrane beta-barrel domain-containing protein [Phascolarctobacterium sp.]|uniref:autotransporter family protein n=1 Tax=Phascolarctobacterium sp. TaxID=2049039 RepID=UPI0025F6D38A|nr:autotransporter outer membrane beta-barrel domain-containing protein [Phascolarctobacterium sp.]MCC8158053.1 autotransporter outer membrane beta-barrel domain-containing protein [Phascolarctobacterium sp.]